MRTSFCKTLVGGAAALLASHSAWALLPIEHWTQDSGAQVWLVNSPTIPMVDV
jgi:zinc protease